MIMILYNYSNDDNDKKSVVHEGDMRVYVIQNPLLPSDNRPFNVI